MQLRKLTKDEDLSFFEMLNDEAFDASETFSIQEFLKAQDEGLLDILAIETSEPVGYAVISVNNEVAYMGYFAIDASKRGLMPLDSLLLKQKKLIVRHLMNRSRCVVEDSILPIIYIYLTMKISLEEILTRSCVHMLIFVSRHFKIYLNNYSRWDTTQCYIRKARNNFLPFLTRHEQEISHFYKRWDFMQ